VDEDGGCVEEVREWLERGFGGETGRVAVGREMEWIEKKDQPVFE
jgi:hypothetical protein